MRVLNGILGARALAKPTSLKTGDSELKEMLVERNMSPSGACLGEGFEETPHSASVLSE